MGCREKIVEAEIEGTGYLLFSNCYFLFAIFLISIFHLSFAICHLSLKDS